MIERDCAACGAPFTYSDRPGNEPTVCYRPVCQSTTWSADRWAAQARMADIRRSAGVDLSEVDRLALTRILQGDVRLLELWARQVPLLAGTIRSATFEL